MLDEPSAPSWSPLDLSVAPTFWYDLQDATTRFQDGAMSSLVTADGQYVRGLADKSGNDLHATNVTGTALYKAAGLGAGLPSVRGAVSTDTLAIPSFALSTPLTLWAVFKQNSTTGYHYLMIHAAGGATKVPLETSSVAPGGPGLYDGASHKSFGVGVQTDLAAYAAVYTAGGGSGGPDTARLWKDNVALGSGAITISNWSQTSVAAILGGAAYFDGDLGEVILCNGTLSSDDLTNLQTYAARWGL